MAKEGDAQEKVRGAEEQEFTDALYNYVYKELEERGIDEYFANDLITGTHSYFLSRIDRLDKELKEGK